MRARFPGRGSPESGGDVAGSLLQKGTWAPKLTKTPHPDQGARRERALPRGPGGWAEPALCWGASCCLKGSLLWQTLLPLLPTSPPQPRPPPPLQAKLGGGSSVMLGPSVCGMSLDVNLFPQEQKIAYLTT